MTSLTSRALRTSSASQPSTSRSEITARWFGGQRLDRPPATSRASPRRAAGPRAARAAATTSRPGTARGRRAGSGRASTAASGIAHGSLQRRERHRAALALRARLRGVDEDAEDPRLQRRAAFEPVERAEHAQPRLLHDLLGDRARRHEDLRDAQERRVPLAHEQRGTSPRRRPAARRRAAHRFDRRRPVPRARR